VKNHIPETDPAFSAEVHFREMKLRGEEGYLEAKNESELIYRNCSSFPFTALVQYKGLFARAAYPGKVAKQGIDIFLQKAHARYATDRIVTACRTEHIA
jgi:hypothetical protein